MACDWSCAVPCAVYATSIAASLRRPVRVAAGSSEVTAGRVLAFGVHLLDYRGFERRANDLRVGVHVFIIREEEGNRLNVVL